MNNRYDVVVVGGGPNGLGIACYLAKSGMSVCVCEDRMELGGGAENTEPIPGFRIDPHATYFYGAAGPGVEQLELHKFGFRMNYYRTLLGGVTSDGKALTLGTFDLENSAKHLSKFSKKDASMFQLMEAQEESRENATNLLRSIYWTPPPPVGVKLDREDLPWVKEIRKRLPIFDPAWLDLSTFEILDLFYDTEPLKVISAMCSWYNGPHPDWAGTGLFGMACNALAGVGSGSPAGGMHTLAHSLARCALTHNVKFLTNSRVEEIIIENGEAKGVILAEDAPVKNKTIYADRAVISGVHVKDTFQKLVPSRWLDAEFIQKVDDINLKGGSLLVLSLITTELPKYKGDAGKVYESGYPTCTFLPADSREAIMNLTKDVYSLNTHPTKPESMILPVCVHDIFDPTRCPPGYHVLSPIYLQMPPPEYHVDGPMAVNDAVDEIVENILETIRGVAPNMTPDKILAKFVNTPYDSHMRNFGFVGGNWMGIRQSEDDWYDFKPLPELARYRTPVHKLYHCNQTSYPGGLCLLAVPYNLMHILIDDLDLSPGEWWYPSQYYIPEEA